MRPTRRSFLIGAASLGLGAHAAPLQAHAVAGPVDPPEAPPPLKLTLDDGGASALQALLKDRVSAVQLMFTSCQATCPIQGALFADAAKKLGERKKAAQLVSISIDPARDTPQALRAWMKRFGASARWRAAQPEKAQLESLVGFLKSKNPAPDPHTAQVYYFDRKARLVLRSVDFPPAHDIVRLLEQLATKDGK
jgi:protein SCO1